MKNKISQYSFLQTNCIVYVDEVGRGSLAGPVVACAVIPTAQTKFKVKNVKSEIARLGDSKKLTAKQREYLYEIFTKIPHIKWAVSSVYPKVIDRINIFEASKLAARRAIEKLSVKSARPDFVIVDGNFKLPIQIPQKSVVKADEKFLPCSIASIIAKVTRDRIMVKLHKKYPYYGFDAHKGYGTKHHYAMLKKYRPSRIHRKSFRLE